MGYWRQAAWRLAAVGNGCVYRGFGTVAPVTHLGKYLSMGMNMQSLVRRKEHMNLRTL